VKIAIFIIGFILGLFCYYSFSSPSSEASPLTGGAGFIENQGAGSFLSPRKHTESTKTCPYEISAYCPCKKCCNHWSDGYTASGHKIAKDDKFVAAPPDIPFGTLLTIEGYAGGRPVPVRDRGSAITKGRLDVFFSDHNSALQWGRQKLTVEISKGEPK